VRTLIVTNMYPTPARPALGSFVADQVQALQGVADVELELFTFTPGGRNAYVRAARELRRRYRRTRFDVVHAHFGLTLWPSLAVSGDSRAVTLHGTDLVHPRSRRLTLAGLPLVDLPATVSESLAALVPPWAVRREVAVLPCGVDVRRFHPIARAQARRELGLEPAGPYLLFPADPRRAEKRHDRAVALAGDVPLLTLGNVAPAQVPLWVNAANAVIVTSERESFGLAVLEALACEVPVLATATGIAPEALAGLPGTWCGPFALQKWRQQLEPHLQAPDPRVPGRGRAERYSSERMAARVVQAWRDLGVG
jgi:teichuronic acid biosynthesis glycosyltransferase TuaC